MAQVNDLIVNGITTFVGSAYGNLVGTAASSNFAYSASTAENSTFSNTCLTATYATKAGVGEKLYWTSAGADFDSLCPIAFGYASESNKTAWTNKNEFNSTMCYDKSFGYNARRNILTIPRIDCNSLKATYWNSDNTEYIYSDTKDWYKYLNCSNDGHGALMFFFCSLKSQTANIPVSIFANQRNYVPVIIEASYASTAYSKLIRIRNDTGNTITLYSNTEQLSIANGSYHEYSMGGNWNNYRQCFIGTSNTNSICVYFS